MIVLTAATSIAVFFVAFSVSGIVETARRSVTVVQATGAAIRDPGLDDRARERATREASLRLAAICGAIALRTAAAAAVSVVPIWAADASGVASAAAVVDVLSRWQSGVVASSLAVIVYALRGRLWFTT